MGTRMVREQGRDPWTFFPGIPLLVMVRCLRCELGWKLFSCTAGGETFVFQKPDPPACKPGSHQELLPPAGAFNYLKENFSNAPSLDMSAASLNMLVRLMVAQVQECVFEKMTLLRAQHDFLSRLQLAQEAARVSSLGRRGLGGAVTTGEAPSRRGQPAVTVS